MSITQKSQETQCTLLKEFFTTSTPVQSNKELSDNEEEIEQDNDPPYVPDPKDIDADDGDDDDTGFDDFGDCLYEQVKRTIYHNPHIPPVHSKAVIVL